VQWDVLLKLIVIDEDECLEAYQAFSAVEWQLVDTGKCVALCARCCRWQWKGALDKPAIYHRDPAGVRALCVESLSQRCSIGLRTWFAEVNFRDLHCNAAMAAYSNSGGC